MDPLSVTASLIAVLQLTTTLMTYLSNVQHARSDQKRVAAEAGHLYGLLISLRSRVEAACPNDPWFQHVRSLGSKNGPLEQFQIILEKVVKKVQPLSTTTSQVKSTLAWHFNKSDVEAAFTQIERLKSLVQIALSEDAFELLKAVRDRNSELVTRVEAVHLDLGHLQARADGDLKNRLARWLQIPDPSTNFHAAQKKRQVGTGAWLLAGQAFLDWRASTSSLLWLHGKAGCGKTVLSATALDQILDDTANQPHTVIAYFYFDFNESEKQRTHHAVRSLLCQCAFRTGAGLQALEELYQRCDDGSRQPSDEQVQLLFYRLVKQARRMYIVLDALDECRDRDEILTFIEKLVVSPQHEIRILATSRFERDIEMALGPIACQTINIQSAVVDADIGMYVHGQLGSDQRLRKWPASVKAIITNELQSKADGMFRWAFCQLESLRRCVQLRDLKVTLSTLPRTLDETYARILQDIQANGHLANAITILQWLCFARRPLRLSELSEILAIEYREEANCGFDPDQRLPDPNDVMTICSGLINCYTTAQSNEQGTERRNDNQDMYGGSYVEPTTNSSTNSDLGTTTWIRLAHFSVQEFLLSDRWFSHSDFRPSACHITITKCCLHYLRYLSRYTNLTRDIVNEYPLADYAAQLWWRHAQNIQTGLGCAVTKLIHSTLTEPCYLLTSEWLAQVFTYNCVQERIFMDLASPLYYAAVLGLSEVTQRLIEESANVNALGGKYGTALVAASALGHEKTVQMLVDAGAEVNAEEGYFGTALQAASMEGYNQVVHILLAAGAKINATGGSLVNALHAASIRGDTQMVQTLLAAGAEVNIQGGPYGNALQAASAGGHSQVVQMLLNAGAEVNARRGRFGNALQAASESGEATIVHMLLRMGAEVNAEGGEFGTALQCASYHGNEQAAQALIAAGANVNAKGGYFGNALKVASRNGKEKIVQMLLAAGADVNTQGGLRSDALAAALEYKHEAIAQMLIDAGAVVTEGEEVRE